LDSPICTIGAGSLAAVAVGSLSNLDTGNVLVARDIERWIAREEIGRSEVDLVYLDGPVVSC
jgi:hypothetical protein